jgi:chromosome segregation ATPase
MAPWIMRPEGYDTPYTTFVSRNKRKIAKAERKIAKAERKIAKAERKIAKAESEIAKAESEIAKAESEIAKAESEIAKAESEIAKAKRLEQKKKQETPSDPTPPSENREVQPELPIFYTRRVPIHEETPSEKMVQDGEDEPRW